jgi:hypothetical protein
MDSVHRIGETWLNAYCRSLAPLSEAIRSQAVIRAGTVPQQAIHPECRVPLPRKRAHASADTVRRGPDGRLESRTRIPAGTKAASTHSVVPAPLYDDLNQVGSEGDPAGCVAI